MTAEPVRLTVPEVRTELRAVAQALVVDHPALAARLDELTGQLIRRYHGRSPRNPSAHMDEALAADIRAYVGRHSWLTMREVGDVFNVAEGRVSEALYGKRGAL